MAKGKEDREVKVLIAKAHAQINELSEFQEFLDSIDESQLNNEVYLETEFRLNCIKNLNNDYKQTHIQLSAMSAGQEEILGINDFFKQFVAVNLKSNSIISKKPQLPNSNGIGQSNSSIISSNSGQTVNARLPKLSVPIFNGDYANFTSYHETFTALIHDNTALTDVERFMYLRDSLRGSASQLIQNIQPTGENYKIAFDLLCDRFNNPKLLISSHVRGIFELKPILKDNAAQIRNLYDNLNKHLRALDNIATPFDYRAVFISHILMSKLDSSAQREFSKFKPKEILTLDEINDFLNQRCQMLEEIEANKTPNSNQNNSHPKNDYSRNNNYTQNNSFSRPVRQPFKQSFTLTNNKISCLNCKSNHSLNHCPAFLALSVKQRIERAGELKTCRNCLYHSSQSACHSRYTCQICERRHHTLLHLDPIRNHNNPTNNYNSPSTSNAQASSSGSSNPHAEEPPRAQATLSCFRATSDQVILPTAVVQIRANDNKWHKARVLLDSGSHINIITEAMVNKLQLKREAISTQILGINSCAASSNSTVKIQISSLHNNYRATLSCVALQKIAENLPLNSFRKCNLNIPHSIRLADENFNCSASIDILIGASLFYNLMSVGQISLGENKPILQKTLLGWVVAGDYLFGNKNKLQNTAYSNLILKDSNEDISLEKSVERFWQVESIVPQCELSRLSPEEQFCERHFDKNVKRESDGRFVVSIPFNSKLACLGDSKHQATERFLRLEKTLIKNPNLRSDYKKFIDEYIALGHMTRLTNHEAVASNLNLNKFHDVDTLNSVVPLSNVPEYFLPHHAVIKPSSLTTKLRVVFDGSAKTTTGISINDAQLTGPVIQNDLLSILLRFRQHIIAITGDIEKMYRQVLINPPERKLQQILWRDNPALPIETYQLNTITYGTASASYLATKCLQRIANSNAHQFPISSEIINNCFYMDDMLAGADTVQDVLKLQSEITAILAGAQLPIRKFLSNSSEIMSSGSQCDPSFFTVPLGERENAKALGLSWNALSDFIQYDSAVKFETMRNTKRTILSAVAQLFDPMGLHSPITIRGKLIIQKLWQLKISWDESIPENLNSEWNTFKAELANLTSLQIPRCIKLPDSISLQLHGFSDSSSVAYGACVYVRSVDASQNICTRLLCSKSRVAPTHGVTIPRLELCAAVLLVQLVQKIKESLTMSFDKLCLWTDSAIVLHWIKSTPNKYKTFVSNRIASIQELSNKNDWFHVRSQDNPADLVSRGMSVNDLISNQTWLSGPNFLSLPQGEWPSPMIQTPNLPVNELRTSANSAMTLLNIQGFNIFEKFSSLTKLQRVLAWINRFKENLRLGKASRHCGPLRPSELQESMNTLVRLCQAESFSQELKMLLAKQTLKTNSTILSLNPFVDENKIIRIGGRIKNSDYSFNKKFPVLLPKNHMLTKLIFRQFHERLLHCGAQQLLACIREQFWPISGRSSAKNIVHHCIRCFKVDPKSYNPLMSDLPLKRIKANLPVFSNVGVDYAGPVLIKDRKTRGAKLIKSYICLFVCLVTKATHLELVTDLTTDAFIAAFRRFIGRRGKPISISSDNAKNFIGAANQLHDLYKFLNINATKETIANFLANQGIKWEFIIPRAPHQGGIWEAGIKSTKLHLKRVLGNTTLNYEEFQTLLIQIEAALNSRPLSPISTDPSDLNPLTPGHFVIGRPLCALPEANYADVSENRLSCYQRLQRLVQLFWKRWSREVIPELQRRTKWFQQLPTLLRVDAVVLINEDNLPPLQWCMGRITQVHSSSDNTPRSATIMTTNGQLIKRSAHKICVLPGVQ